MAARLDIWTVDLRAISADPAILSDEERGRRFRTGNLRRRHLAACTALRRTLAFYAGMAPVDLFFGRDSFGKPFLKGRPDIAFSLAHAGEAAVLAVCEGPGIAPAIGVDIEPFTAPPEADSIVRGFFSPADRAVFDVLDTDRKGAAFPRLWTRKEAVAKVEGGTEALPFESFTVGLDCDVAIGTGRRWPVISFEPLSSYIAAAATSADAMALRYCRP